MYMRRTGFSLAELLVAMAVIAIVMSIAAPRFLRIRQQAELAAQQQNVSRLNKAFAIWEAAGGFAGGNVLTSDVVRMLGAAPGVVLSYPGADPTSSADDIYDSPLPAPTRDASGNIISGSGAGTSSSSMRVALPSSIVVPSGSTATVAIGNDLLYFSPTTDKFRVISSSSAVDLGRTTRQYVTRTWFNTDARDTTPEKGYVGIRKGSEVIATGNFDVDCHLYEAVRELRGPNNTLYKFTFELAPNPIFASIPSLANSPSAQVYLIRVHSLGTAD